MKKNFLLAIAVMLMTAVSSFAQNEQKEYNMVITLNNGTTVTLGHNDIKDITFNDGEISISGDVVSTIDKLRDFTEYLDHRIMAEREEQYTRIQELEDKMAEQLGDIDNRINNMAAAVDKNFAIYKDALNAMAAAVDEKFATVNEQFGIVDDNFKNVTAIYDENFETVNNNFEIVNENFAKIISVIEQLHPEIANTPEFKAAKAAVAAKTAAKASAAAKTAKVAAIKK